MPGLVSGFSLNAASGKRCFGESRSCGAVSRVSLVSPWTSTGGDAQGKVSSTFTGADVL